MAHDRTCFGWPHVTSQGQGVYTRVGLLVPRLEAFPCYMKSVPELWAIHLWEHNICPCRPGVYAYTTCGINIIVRRNKIGADAISITFPTAWKTALTLSQWSSSGNPVAIQCAWNLDPSVHWNATGEMPVCFQWSSSGFPVAFQWSSSVFQLCKLTLDRHWNTTGCKHQPVWFQWHPSVLVAPVVFQCVPIMQINTGSPLEHHWVLASASVVPVASQCTCGSSGLPVRSVQWYPSVLT